MSDIEYLDMMERDHPQFFGNLIQIVDSIHTNFESSHLQLVNARVNRGDIQVPMRQSNAWILEGYLQNKEWMNHMGFKHVEPENIHVEDISDRRMGYVVIRTTLELLTRFRFTFAEE